MSSGSCNIMIISCCLWSCSNYLCFIMVPLMLVGQIKSLVSTISCLFNTVLSLKIKYTIKLQVVLVTSAQYYVN